MFNIPEFIAKMIILVATYYVTLEYVFTCELQTWIGGIILIVAFVVITVLYMVFRAGKITSCRQCGHGIFT